MNFIGTHPAKGWQSIAQIARLLATLLSFYLLLLSNALTGQIVINEIMPDGTIELKNVGTIAEDVSTYWLCDFPSYQQISNSNIICGSPILAPGELIAVDNFNVVSTADGEMGLYATNSFGSSSAMIDYVEWGSTGHTRSSVAVEAGIWTTGAFVPAFGATESLEYDGDGNDVADWTAQATPTICEENGGEAPCTTDGGTISTTDPTTICVDGNPDPINVTIAGSAGTNAGWIITDTANNILGLPAVPPFDLDGAGEGVCVIWYIRYEDGLTGNAVGNNVSDLVGCYDLSNGITVTRQSADGGMVSLLDGSTDGDFCAGDVVFEVQHTTTADALSYWYIITNENNEILDFHNTAGGNMLDLSGAPAGTCRIWGWSYSGLDDPIMGEDISSLTNDDCEAISNNYIEINRFDGGPVCGGICEANGGLILTNDPTTICVDGNPDPINVELVGNVGTNSAWLITDFNNNILGLPAGGPFDLDGAGEGVCVIWHISYEDGLVGLEVGSNVFGLDGCFAISNAIIVTRQSPDGGNVALSNGETEGAYCAGNVVFDVTHTTTADALSYWYIITNDNNEILGFHNTANGNTLDLSVAPAGICRIWGWSYSGLGDPIMGDDISSLMDDDCEAISDNYITINRETPDGGMISLSDGSTTYTGTAGDIIFDVQHTTTASNLSYWYIITDNNDNILDWLNSADGNTLDLSAAPAGECHIWGWSYNGLDDPIMGDGIFTLDDGTCESISSNWITVIREEGGNCVAEGGELSALTGNVYNRVVIANRASKTISVINSDNNQVESTYDMPDDGEPMYVVYNDYNNTVLVGDYNGKVAAFDGKTFEHVGSADAGAGVFHMWLSSDNQQLWVNNELDKTVSVINPNTMTNIATFSIPADLEEAGYKPHDVIIMPNNAAAFVTMLGPLEQDYVVKYSTVTFEETDRAAVGSDPHVSLTSANDKLYIASQETSEVKVLNRSDLSEVTTVSVPNAHGLGMNNAGTYLYIGNISEGGVDATHTLDLSTNTLLGTGVDATFSAPHNYSVIGDDSKLFVTHSGASNDQVSVYALSPEPTLMTTISVGSNPFGLVSYTFVETTGELTICAGDGASDAFDVQLSGEEGTNSAWIITDIEGNILGMPTAPPFDLEGAGAGTCLIWHISYEDGLEGAIVGNNASDLVGCYDLSNPITVYRFEGETSGGEISTNDPTTICVDGNADPINITLEGAVGANSQWIITDTDGNVLGLPAAPPFDLDGAGVGVCVIWHLSYLDGLVGLVAGNHVTDLEGCYNLSNGITVTRVDDGSACNTGEGADLSMSISSDISMYNQYEGIVYTITVTNEGGETATDIVISAPIPDEMAHSGNEADLGGYSVYYEEWDIESLAPGETATLYLDLFTLVENVNIVNFVEVIAVNETDPDSSPGNGDGLAPNEDDEAVLIIIPFGGGGTGSGEGDIDLELSLEADSDTYTVYEHVTYTYTLTNNGTDAATEIFVNAYIPEGMAHSYNDANGGNYSLYRQHWEIDYLGAGETVTLELVLFPLVSGVDIVNYSQVFAAEQQDVDSTPNNGNGVTPNEDDEAAVVLTSASNFGEFPNAFVLETEEGIMMVNSVYPNPSINNISLNVASPKDVVAKITIVNLQGKIVHKQEYELTMGVTELGFDISDLAPGQYFINLNGVMGSEQAQSFVKAR